MGSFERVRVDGPFDVRIATGGSPGAHADGDARILDRVTIEVNGTTLTVRLGSGVWGETPAGGTAPVIVLTTPRLVSAVVTANAKVTIAGMRSQRVDLQLTGGGMLTATGVDADDVNATLLGTGSIAVAGRSGRGRLATNGTGLLDASALVANDLIVRLEGAGAIKGYARYTAQVGANGLGSVTIGGHPKCTIRAGVAGPVVCGQ